MGARRTKKQEIQYNISEMAMVKRALMAKARLDKRIIVRPV
jgi:hypothetical protein